MIIHESGTGADKLSIDSQHNGMSYNVCFGEAGHPMRNIFFQGDDAATLRATFDKLEEKKPNTPDRNLWLQALDDYLF